MSGKPRILDGFCGGGGAGAGYARAGFDVTGVDLYDQARYPFTFHQRGFLAWLEQFVCTGEWPDGERYDAIHTSPPCQAYSNLAAMHPGRTWVDLIPPTRSLLEQTGLPYVIENVEGAPLAHHPQLDGTWGIVLCGSMFGLGVERGELRRHRAFESNVPLPQPSCSHQRVAVGVYGHGGHSGKRRMLYRAEAAEAMQIDWQNRDEMTQAIPPAYTEFIGEHLMAHLRNRETEAV